MAILSGFFPSVSGDRKYTNSFLAQWVHSFIGNGVYDGDFTVSAGENMNVMLPKGQAWINGYYYRNDGPITLAIENADGVLNRKDTVVLRWDINARSITAQVVKGTPASTASAPAITRNVEQYDLKLAEISIPAGTTAITQANITDTRLDTDVCGIVTGIIKQADTTTLYKQIQSDLSQFKGVNEADFSSWSAEQKTAFNNWLDGIKTVLDGDTAGNLLNLINQHKGDLVSHIKAGEREKWNASGVSTYIHEKTGTIHNLKGTGNNIEFLATADIADGDTWQVNGKSVTAVLSNGEPLTEDTFKSGNWVTGVRLDGDKLNFRCGGGGYGTLSAQINNFYATIDDASVQLTWSNPSDDNFAGVLIVHKTGGYPQKPSDGTKVYEGTGTSYKDTGLMNGTQYYYRAFAYNAKKEYQTAYCVATMTPIAGHQLGTFPVGTKIKFGSIFGNSIVMKIANKSGSDITLISDGIIVCYAFDAKEPSNSNSRRQNYGNNRYRYSNIHQWLNSEAGTGAWYAAQHSADQAPDSTSVVSMNPYKSAAGFLSGFNTKEKKYLKTISRTVGKSNTDGGGTETLNARVWLPSETEVGLETEFAEGSQFQAFSDNNSRIAYETADCASHTGGTAGNAGWYWLRTPYASYVRLVHLDGSLGYDNAYNGCGGVRPICVLDSSVLISLSVDSDGCYIVL